MFGFTITSIPQLKGIKPCHASTYLGKNLAKLDDAEMIGNRNGASNDPKADAAVRFAVKVTRLRCHSDAQVIEIVMHVALNTWKNYVNEVGKTDIDFPVVTLRLREGGWQAADRCRRPSILDNLRNRS